MTIRSHEFQVTLDSNTFNLRYGTLGEGQQPLLFVGPMSVYKKLFGPEFLARFQLFGFVDCLWEGEDLADFSYSVADVVQLYSSLAAELELEEIVWFGVSALSYIAIECALENPENTLAIINSGFAIWLPSSNVNEYIEQSHMLLQQEPNKAIRYADDNRAYERFCEVNSLNPQLAPFQSSEANVLEFLCGAETLFHDCTALKANNNALLNELANPWREINLKAKALAFTYVTKVDIERLSELKVPCLSISGSSDLRTPVGLFEKFLEIAPEHLTKPFTLAEVERAGHFSHYEMPVEFANLIEDFLDPIYQQKLVPTKQLN